MTDAYSRRPPTAISRLSSTFLMGTAVLFCIHAPAVSQAISAHVHDTHLLQPVPTARDAVEIVVRFKDDARVKEIIDIFWRDPQASKAKFDIFKQNRPEMAAASLMRVTYSSELVLAYPFKTETKAQRVTEARAIAARLATTADVVYAEPDLAFQTQH
jgi:hypothetical protein